MDEGFAAQCTRCGAPQTLSLQAPVMPCAHCGTSDPLDPPTRARVHAVAAQLSKVIAREQRLLSAQLSDAKSLAWMIPAFSVTTWGIFGGMALAVIDGEKPAKYSFVEMLGVVRTAKGGLDGFVAAWWALFLMVIGVAATLSTYLFLLHRIRAQVRVPPSLPPLVTGAAPRCRLCGAGLHASGVRRVCESCGAASLVDGKALTASTTAFTEQLATLERRLLGETAATHGWAERLIYAATAYPLMLIFALPAGLLLPETRPDLLWIAAVVAAPALLFGVLIALQSLPPDPFMGRLRPGDRVRVRGLPHRVLGKLSVDSQQLKTGVGVLFLLAPEGAPQPTLAAFAFDDTSRAYEVHAGGRPYDSGPLSVVDLEEPSGASKSGAPPGEDSLRIFPSPQPAPGAVPRWTLVPLDLAPDDFVLLF